MSEVQYKIDEYHGDLKDIPPGIYSNLTNEQYHNSPGLSKSGVALLLKSPAHYWTRYLDPEREPFVQTKAMRIGTLAHKLLLEPDTFSDEFTVLSEEVSMMNKNRKDYKAAVAAIEETGKVPVLTYELKQVLELVETVRNHPTAKHFVTNGFAEQSFYWIDPDFDVLCKCRPDYWIPGVALPDLKKTTDARADKFSKSCADYTYYIQSPFYSDGVEHLTGDRLAMPFIAVEELKPFGVGIYRIDDIDEQKGRDDYKRALEIYARCVEFDTWPAYRPEVQIISLPKWAMRT